MMELLDSSSWARRPCIFSLASPLRLSFAPKVAAKDPSILETYKGKASFTSRYTIRVVPSGHFILVVLKNPNTQFIYLHYRGQCKLVWSRDLVSQSCSGQAGEGARSFAETNWSP